MYLINTGGAACWPLSSGIVQSAGRQWRQLGVKSTQEAYAEIPVCEVGGGGGGGYREKR